MNSRSKQLAALVNSSLELVELVVSQCSRGQKWVICNSSKIGQCVHWGGRVLYAKSVVSNELLGLRNLICIYSLIVRKIHSVNYINVSTTWKVDFLVIDSHVCCLVVFVGLWKYIFLMIYKLFTEANIEMFFEQYRRNVQLFTEVMHCCIIQRNTYLAMCTAIHCSYLQVY